MKPAYFGPCLCCINIDKNNYPEETELDINHSLTPRFLIFLIWIHKTIWGGIQSLDQKSIADEKSQLYEIYA